MKSCLFCLRLISSKAYDLVGLENIFGMTIGSIFEESLSLQIYVGSVDIQMPFE